jgi:hypothetical protein
VTGVSVAWGQAPGASKRSEMADMKMTLRIGDELRDSGGHSLPSVIQGYINSLIPPCLRRRGPGNDCARPSTGMEHLHRTRLCTRLHILLLA